MAPQPAAVGPRSKRRAVRQAVRQWAGSWQALVAQLRCVAVTPGWHATACAHMPRSGLCSAPSWQYSLNSAAVMLVPALSRGTWQNLASNHVFLVGFWAWLTAQTMKVHAPHASIWQAELDGHAQLGTAQIFTKKVKKGVWDVKAMVDSGGMPSSHSSLCMVRLCCYPATYPD